MSAAKPLWKSFLRFLAPLMLSNALQSLFGTVSNVYLGQMIGIDALASVSVFFPVMFFLFAFVMGLSTGATVLIGQAYGAGEQGRIKLIVGTTLAIGLLLSIAIALIGGIFSRQLMMMLATPADILDQASAYARIMLLTMPLGFVFLLMTAMIRGVGDALTPLLALALSTAIGLILTPMLIRGSFGLPAAGITSPAWAAAIANALTLVALAAYLLRRKHALAPDAALLRHLRLNRVVLGQILGIGLPSAIGMVVMAIAELVLLGLVNGFGSNATAAYGAVNQVMGYTQFTAMSISIAVSILGAQAVGRGDRAGLDGIVRTGLAFNIVLTGGLVALIYLAPRAVLGIFITDDTVLELAKSLSQHRTVELGAVRPGDGIFRRDARCRRGTDANAARGLRHYGDRAAIRSDPEPHDWPSGCVGRLSDRVLRHVPFADGLLPSGVAQADDPAPDLTKSSRDYDRH
ncbi:putative MATE family efflux protein [Bradyrhizobium sp. GM2.4]